MQTALAFDDVLIKPAYSTVPSRKVVELDTLLDLKLPVISANMDTITGVHMANAMHKAGGAGCLHRFWTVEDNMYAFNQTDKTAWVSIGLGDEELRRAQMLFEIGAKVFVIDVAHGANERVAYQARFLRQIVGTKASIIVGNFATAESIVLFDDKSEKSADAFKVGIGGGSACTTRIETGCGMPTLQSVMDCARTMRPIIADGGMRTPGDIAKALAAGAFAVMIGGMLAGTDETPGEVVASEDCQYKKYRGSASQESYKVQGKDDAWRTAEGDSYLVKCKGPAAKVLQRIAGGLNSAFSYVGARELKEFQAKAELIQITSSGVKENGAHGK